MKEAKYANLRRVGFYIALKNMNKIRDVLSLEQQAYVEKMISKLLDEVLEIIGVVTCEIIFKYLSVKQASNVMSTSATILQ